MRSDQTNTIKLFKKGDPVDHRRFNETVRILNRRGAGVKPPTQRPVDSKNKAVISARQFKVTTELNNYLDCKVYDGSTRSVNAETFRIAKPFKLRGDTATRTSDSEEQEIVEAYTSGDIIYAIKNIKGGTDVKDSSNDDVEWLDLNVDGRAWARSQPT